MRRQERPDAFADYGPTQLVTVPRGTRLGRLVDGLCATVELELLPAS